MPTAQPDIDAVVFDLGGVLAEFSGVLRMRELAVIDSDDELWRRWLECDWVRRFERGGCSAEDFAAGVVADWQLPISGEEFLDTFASWVQEPFEGAEQLVADTAAHVAVAMLSNMNAIHWEQAVGGWPLVGHFDHVFTSFQLGLIKPDAEIFEHVVATLAVEPGRILFLDDNIINAEGARAAGLHAERVRGVTEARAAIDRILQSGPSLGL